MLKLFNSLLVLSLAIACSVHACTLSMQAQHYPPRFIKQIAPDGTLSWQGFNADLFSLLAEEAGCNTQIIQVPWGRALQLLASGDLDAMSNMSHNAERESFAHFVGPHQQERIVVLANNARHMVVKDLAALLSSQEAISVMQGIYYGEQFERALAQQPNWEKRLIYVSSSQQKLELFLAGRVYFTFEDSINLQQLYNEGILNPQQHKPLFTLHQNPVYFAFSKHSVSATQLQKLQQAWQRISNDGRLQALKQHYFPQSYPR